MCFVGFGFGRGAFVVSIYVVISWESASGVSGLILTSLWAVVWNIIEEDVIGPRVTNEDVVTSGGLVADEGLIGSGSFVVDIGAFVAKDGALVSKDDVLIDVKCDFVAKDGVSVASVTLVVDVRRLKVVILSVGFSVTLIVVVRRWPAGWTVGIGFLVVVVFKTGRVTSVFIGLL